mmetsp:Transcript_38492/g.121790  ORF Transcript_38492/g.121790 Transcript_38492/m.121790 type:complete len:210 (+) Transcript_38492:3470-4099(+)
MVVFCSHYRPRYGRVGVARAEARVVAPELGRDQRPGPRHAHRDLGISRARAAPGGVARAARGRARSPAHAIAHADPATHCICPPEPPGEVDRLMKRPGPRGTHLAEPHLFAHDGPDELVVVPPREEVLHPAEEDSGRHQRYRDERQLPDLEDVGKGQCHVVVASNGNLYRLELELGPRGRELGAEVGQVGAHALLLVVHHAPGPFEPLL